MKSLLYLIIERSRIILCPIIFRNHKFTGPKGYGVSGCTRCLQMEEEPTTNKKILEVFEERETAGLKFFENVAEREQ